MSGKSDLHSRTNQNVSFQQMFSQNESGVNLLFEILNKAKQDKASYFSLRD